MAPIISTASRTPKHARGDWQRTRGSFGDAARFHHSNCIIAPYTRQTLPRFALRSEASESEKRACCRYVVA